MEYIKTLLLHTIGLLILFNLCVMLIPRKIRLIIGKVTKSLFNVTYAIINLSIKYYKQELSKPSEIITPKKVINGETNITSNVIPFRKKQI